MCKDCLKYFVHRTRLCNDELWQEYTQGKQTYKQLAIKHNLSIRTIQRRLDKVRVVKSIITNKEQNPVCLIIDTTYFGRDFGVMVFMDNVSGKVLHYSFVKYETNALYRMGIHKLNPQFTLQSITCDGRRGLLGSFGAVPTQMCHFHQIAIIRRHLTKKPKHKASQELLVLTKTLTTTSKEVFINTLTAWYDKHKDYLNERSQNKEGKSWYTHKRLRSAYHSLKRNPPYLFVCEQNQNTPNTTNKLEGLFGHLKQSLRCHQGLNRQRKQKVIESFLQVCT